MLDGEWHYMTVEDKEEHSQLARTIIHVAQSKTNVSVEKGEKRSLLWSGGFALLLKWEPRTEWV